MEPSKIVAKEIFKSFGEKDKKLDVLTGITKTFEQGKTYAITGASGSGKSTLLHILGELDHPTSGSVIRDKGGPIGFVFQFHYLINELTVLENLILMGQIQDKSKASCKKKATELLNKVGLTNKAENYPYELSGGEQQRISILRAIFNEPQFLLADEPTGNLDAKNAEMIVNFMISCQKDWGMGLILCSHDQSAYSRMEHVFRLEDGVLR